MRTEPTPIRPVTSIAELNDCIKLGDPVERCLQTARWICASKASYGPKHANAWREPATAREYADHVHAVAFVELTNAGTLWMLVETVLGLQRGLDADPDADRVTRRHTALTHLLAIVGGPWRIGDADLADKGDGKAAPFESWRAWAARKTRLPECYPPKGYEPPRPPQGPSNEPPQFGRHRVRFLGGGR